MPIPKYNWEEIQKKYDSGLSTRDLVSEFNITMGIISDAIKKGFFKRRSIKEARKTAAINKPQKHTEEAKRKISARRTAYLKLHPEKVPYRLNHSSKRSIPELIFEKALKEYGLTNFEPEKPMSIYQFDFAFPEERIDVEIDGKLHLTDSVKSIDERRDKWTESIGWRVIRFTASEVCKDVNVCLNKLLEIMNLPKLEIKQKIKTNPRKNKCECGKEIFAISKRCSSCHRLFRRKVSRPSLEELKQDLSNSTYVAVGKKYGVSDNTIRKWIKTQENALANQNETL